MPDWVVMVAINAIISAVVLITVGPRLRRWVVRRSRGPRAFDLGVRVLEGSLPGAGRRWRHGVAVVEGDGAISWKGRPRVIRPVRVTATAPRRPTPREWWVVSPAVDVYEAHTAGARLELAVAPRDAHRLQELSARPEQAGP